jgi:ABC-type multidrug transport system ATPase subunit
MEEAEALCDRIGIMASGSLRACGTAKELKAYAQADSIEQAFVSIVREGKI